MAKEKDLSDLREKLVATEARAASAEQELVSLKAERQTLLNQIFLKDDALKAAEQERDSVLSSPMAAGLLIKLREECEAQHARAEAAEAVSRRLQEQIETLREKFDALLIREVKVFGGIPEPAGRTGKEEIELREAIAALLAANGKSQ